MRPILRYWLLYICLLYASIIANYALGVAAPDVSRATMQALMERIPSGASALAIFIYNSKVALVSATVIGAIILARRSGAGRLGWLLRGLAGVGVVATVAAVVLVGFMVGMVLSNPELNAVVVERCGTRSVLFAGIFTHGWLELSAVALLFSTPVAYSRGERESTIAKATAAGVVMLLAAALIEAYVTPRVAASLCSGSLFH